MYQAEDIHDIHWGLLDHRSEFSKEAESHECIIIFAPHLHAVGVFPSIRRTPCHNIRQFSESEMQHVETPSIMNAAMAMQCR